MPLKHALPDDVSAVAPDTERQHHQGRGLAYPSDCQEASVMPHGITKEICRSRRGAWTGVLAVLAWASGIRCEPRTTRFRGDDQPARRAVRPCWL